VVTVKVVARNQPTPSSVTQPQALELSGLDHCKWLDQLLPNPSPDHL